MMDKDIDLDALFAEAADGRFDPSPQLASRILADAAREQPKPQAFVRQAKSPVQLGWFAGFTDVLGGVRSVAALSMVGLMGLYLGVAQPSGVQSLTTLLSGDTTTVEQMDLLPATGALWAEE